MKFEIVKTFYSSKNNNLYNLIKLDIKNATAYRLYCSKPNSKSVPILDKFYINNGNDIKSIERANVNPITFNHRISSVIYRKGKDFIGYTIANKRGHNILSCIFGENKLPYIFQKSEVVKTKNNAPMVKKLIRKTQELISNENPIITVNPDLLK